ncbi:MULTISPECIES: hypothetical protein [Bacteria]
MSGIGTRAGRFRLFRVIGVASVIVGGLVAAVTSPLNLAHGSWAAAYLVLVNGVSQIALGDAQATLARRAPSSAIVTTQLIGWNAGGAAVIGGTVARTPLLVDAGGVLLVLALALMIRAVGWRRRGAPTWPLRLYRLLVMLMLISIPVGLVLAHLREP